MVRRKCGAAQDGYEKNSVRVYVFCFALLNADILSSRRHVSEGATTNVASRHRMPCHRYRAPSALTKSFSNSDGSPGQQDSGAEREHHKSRPIRFDPKAASGSFRFQGVTGWSGAEPTSTT